MGLGFEFWVVARFGLPLDSVPFKKITITEQRQETRKLTRLDETGISNIGRK